MTRPTTNLIGPAKRRAMGNGAAAEAADKAKYMPGGRADELRLDIRAVEAQMRDDERAAAIDAKLAAQRAAALALLAEMKAKKGPPPPAAFWRVDVATCEPILEPDVITAPDKVPAPNPKAGQRVWCPHKQEVITAPDTVDVPNPAAGQTVPNPKAGQHVRVICDFPDGKSAPAYLYRRQLTMSYGREGTPDGQRYSITWRRITKAKWPRLRADIATQCGDVEAARVESIMFPAGAAVKGPGGAKTAPAPADEAAEIVALEAKLAALRARRAK